MHSKHTYFNIWRPIHYLHLLIPTLEDPANQGSRMYTQRTVSAPWIESLSEGLSWRRKPFLNQWTVFTTITPLKSLQPFVVCRGATIQTSFESVYHTLQIINCSQTRKNDKLSNKVTVYARSNYYGLYPEGKK